MFTFLTTFKLTSWHLNALGALAGTGGSGWSGLEAADGDAALAGIDAALPTGAALPGSTARPALGCADDAALHRDLGAAVVTPPPTAPEALPSAQSVASRLLPRAPRMPAPAGANDEGATSRAMDPIPHPGNLGMGLSPLPTPPGGSLSPGLMASLAGFREPTAQGGSGHPRSGTRPPKQAHAQGPDASLAGLREPGALGAGAHRGPGAKPAEQPRAQVATAQTAAAAAAAAAALETAAAAVLRAQCGAAGQSLAGPGQAGHRSAAWPTGGRASACARRGRSQGGLAALAGSVSAPYGVLGPGAKSGGRSGGRAPGNRSAPAPASAACATSPDFSA